MGQIGKEIALEKCRISNLDLARIVYPNGKVTSGAGQDYLAKIDRKHLRGAALFGECPNGTILLSSPCESMTHRLTRHEFDAIRKTP